MSWFCFVLNIFVEYVIQESFENWTNCSKFLLHQNMIEANWRRERAQHQFFHQNIENESPTIPLSKYHWTFIWGCVFKFCWSKNEQQVDMMRKECYMCRTKPNKLLACARCSLKKFCKISKWQHMESLAQWRGFRKYFQWFLYYF